MKQTSFFHPSSSKSHTLSPFLSLCLLLTISLTACRGKPKTQEAPQMGYIRFSLFCDVNFWKPPQWETKEGTITGEISKKTGVVIDTTVPAQDADKQLSLLLVNGELPDLSSVTDPTVISQLVDSGKVWDLEEFFQTYLPDSHILQDFPKDVRKMLEERDGGWYAWPSHIDSDDARKHWLPSAECYADEEEYLWNCGIIWNRKLLEILGISLEELGQKEQAIEAFARAKEWNQSQNREEIIPLLVDGEDYQDYTLEFLQESFGMLPIGEDGAYVSPILQPETKEALQFLNLALREGYVTPGQMTWRNLKVKDKLASGQVLCFIGNIANTDINALEWVSSGQLRSESGKSPVWGKRRTATTGWLSTFVSKSCEHPKELAVWLDYMTSEEGLLLWDCGQEGVDYVLDGSGLVRRLSPEESPERNETSVWWPFGNIAWLWSVLAPYEEGSQEEALSQIRVAYAKAEGTEIYNASLLDVSLEGEAMKQEEALNAYIRKTVSSLILAESQEAFEETYARLLQYLEQNGIHKLDREKDRLYQEKCREAGESLCLQK